SAGRTSNIRSRADRTNRIFDRSSASIGRSSSCEERYKWLHDVMRRREVPPAPRPRATSRSPGRRSLNVTARSSRRGPGAPPSPIYGCRALVHYRERHVRHHRGHTGHGSGGRPEARIRLHDEGSQLGICAHDSTAERSDRVLELLGAHRGALHHDEPCGSGAGRLPSPWRGQNAQEHEPEGQPSSSANDSTCLVLCHQGGTSFPPPKRTKCLHDVSAVVQVALTLLTGVRPESP